MTICCARLSKRQRRPAILMPDRRPLRELFSQRSIEGLPIAEFLSAQKIAPLAFNQHPLGFVHVALGRENDYAFRLHVWPDLARYEQQPYWPLHNHKFDLISRVLAGSLTNREYKVEQTCERTPYQLYDVAYRIGSSIMSRSEVRVNVEACGLEHLTAPSVYSIRAGTFHDTRVPLNVFTATLVVTRNSLQDGDVKTVGDAGGQLQYEYIRSEITPKEKEAIIDRLGG